VTTIGLTLAGIAAAVHVYIFVLESVLWTSAAGRRVFGTTPEQAAATRELAYNQGFYNLFLAATTVVGIALVAAGQDAPGFALVLAGTGSMVLAGTVLVLSSRDKARAALVQAVPPALAVVVLVLELLP
jgi:putative membrane protein